VFLATGAFFLVAAGIAAFFREQPAPHQAGPGRFRQFLGSTWRELKREARFRYLILVVSLLYVFLLLFPHYASYGQATFAASSRDLVAWIVVQNIGFALISVFLGNLADQRGYRLALLFILIGLTLGPLVAVVAGSCAPAVGAKVYWLVFFLLGCAPASQRILTNYVLEFAPVGRESQYLGTVNLVQLLPLAGAPLVGWAMDRYSYEPVFLAGAAVLVLGLILALRLPEPRQSVLD
jgi:predicted MFS family arabinose efflux permease